MSMIKDTFLRLKVREKTALIPYITAGDTNPELTVPMMHALVRSGADILELGVPFSDPMADGPVIQLACERALAYNISLADVLDMVAEFRKTNITTPVVLMGYLNPIEAMGYEVFAKRAGEVGVNGVLTVDMPPEEANHLITQIKPLGIDPIFLLAQTSTETRIKFINSVASGFVYYVSLKGVTGSVSLDVDSVEVKLKEVSQHTKLPIGVGFGIKDAVTAKAMAGLGDAIIIGSAIVNIIGENVNNPEMAIAKVSAFVTKIRQAID